MNSGYLKDWASQTPLQNKDELRLPERLSITNPIAK
jgi:hypothetical protein